jgi:hypothetical protein
MEKMLSLPIIAQMLRDRKLVYVAKQVGMSHPTIKRVADGDTQVSRTTQQKLSDYLLASCAPAMND